MQSRHEYVLNMSGDYSFPTESGNDLKRRHPLMRDQDLLGELMLDSYRGTIDYEGETLTEAREEMATSLAGKHGESLLDCSWLLFSAAELVAACLAIRWRGDNCAFITYVMTGNCRKGSGLGATVLQATLASLVRAGFREVRAVITDGNLPSERLFRRAGFIQVEKE